MLLAAALQSTCCLPEPWTKHITAPKQHGILLYLPTAAPVLPSDPPLLTHLSHTHAYLRIHSPHHAHLNECTEGRGDVSEATTTPPLCATTTPPQRALCLQQSVRSEQRVHFSKITQHSPSIRNTAIEQKQKTNKKNNTRREEDDDSCEFQPVFLPQTCSELPRRGERSLWEDTC